MLKAHISFIFQRIKNLYHFLKAYVANLYYAYPSHRLKVIGVTGTDGKTTTATLIYHIFNSVGRRCALISSIGAYIDGTKIELGLHTTTPDAFFLQQLLKAAQERGVEYVVLETTSHALDQYRNWGIHFKTSVVTNITAEHLDYHLTYKNYLKAKERLLLSSRLSVINIDDESFVQLKDSLTKAHKQFVTYGLENKATYTIDIKKELRLTIPQYNNYNYLAAYAVSVCEGLSSKKILDAMATYELPEGRLEVVSDKDFQVIIDFAHTPNAFKNLLQSLKKQVGKGKRLIHVFGSAGLRDSTKRPNMGEQSGEYADCVILTEEDYRTEDPQNICRQIAQGLEKKKLRYINPQKLKPKSKGVYTIIIQRDEAIQKAIDIAERGDIVVTTGKSHEQSLCRGRREYPWDEKKAVLSALARRYKSTPV